MIVSAATLILLAPALAVIAAVVRLSDGGSVLYRQTRVGLDGHRFTIIKFRTMLEQAERDLGAIWSVPNDPRCTGIGYYLRRSGFDELPQLWNILRGDMSLVGPRPERPEFTPTTCATRFGPASRAMLKFTAGAATPASKSAFATTFITCATGRSVSTFVSASLR